MADKPRRALGRGLDALLPVAQIKGYDQKSVFLCAIERIVPLVGSKIAQHGRATAYVCERRTCELPTTDPDVFAAQITRRR